MAVKAQPDGYHSITPYLITHDASAAIEFYKTAFGATELMRLPGPFGHSWAIATHTEDVSPEEIDRRFQEMMSQGGGGS